MPAYKVASFELVDLPLIEKIARTGKPMIMSTGMATLAEIDEAVQAARRGGATQIALLKCSSAYPAAPAEMNLSTIPHLSAAFGLPVGLSDHTLGLAVPVTAVALGACIIEKALGAVAKTARPRRRLLARTGRISRHGRGGSHGATGGGPRRLRRQSAGSGQPGVPPLAVRDEGHCAGELLYPRQRPQRPPGQRSAAEVPGPGVGTDGKLRPQGRHAAELGSHRLKQQRMLDEVNLQNEDAILARGREPGRSDRRIAHPEPPLPAPRPEAVVHCTW